MNKNIILNTKYNDYLFNGKINIPKIPKKIHQIWLGSMNDKVNNLSEKIKEIHHDWEYKLWTYDDIESLNLINKDLFNNLKNKGAQSDVLRYEIVNKYGGIYLDTDFYMIKKFDDILSLDFFSGNGSDDDEVYNGLFGSIPNHPILNRIINQLSELDANKVYSIDDIMNKTGPYLFANIVFDYLNDNMDSNITIFPKEYFYSLPGQLRHMLRDKNYDEEFIKENLTEKSICVHLWENSWQ